MQPKRKRKRTCCPAISQNNLFFIHCGQQINPEPVPSFTVETNCSAGIGITIQSSEYICGSKFQFCHFTRDFDNFNKISIRGMRSSERNMEFPTSWWVQLAAFGGILLSWSCYCNPLLSLVLFFLSTTVLVLLQC